MDTIFALSTAPGRAGVSIIRVSGPDVRDVMTTYCGRALRPRTAELCRVRDLDGQAIDEAVCIFFEGPNSFSGEDVLELHLHGSIAVIDRMMSLLGQFEGCRPAAAGEFTRRALSNGKMDLIEVEGLSDLIDAETEQQRLQARASLSGAFQAFVFEMREDLVRSAALLEASIDFADEEVPEDVSAEVVALLNKTLAKIDHELNGFKFAERVRSGFEVAIVGAPNAGKSTLLNALAGREAAITSEYAGTTRDIVEVRMDIDGIPVTLLDTAGLRDTNDPVEAIGVSKALERAADADIRVFLLDNNNGDIFRPQEGDIVRMAKGDENGLVEGSISGLTGFGLDALMEDLAFELRSRVSKAGLSNRRRHEDAMRSAQERLVVAVSEVSFGQDRYDIAAEEIRRALYKLDALVGRVDVENLLDVIFSSFCVGK